jgi:hypothetical protein
LFIKLQYILGFSKTFSSVIWSLQQFILEYLMGFFVQSYDYTNLINIKRRNIKIKIMYKIRKKFKIKFTKVNEKFEDLKGQILNLLRPGSHLHMQWLIYHLSNLQPDEKIAHFKLIKFYLIYIKNR